MEKVGRNDPCPCRSGNKYKNCCLNKKDMIDFFKVNFNSQYIDNSYMLKSLTSMPSKLTEFLVHELPKIRGEIIWLFNPKLDSRMRSVNIEGLNGIIFKEIPISEEYYFDLAHELGHIILGEQGYPMGFIKDNDMRKTYLATILMNTVMDPLVNKYVNRYGFDFEEYMKKGIRIQLPIIDRYSQENNLHTYDRYFLVCLIIEKIQDWKLVNDNESEFESKFKYKYPNLYREAKEIVDEIENLNIVSPEEAREILTKILDKYNMNNIVGIR